MSLEVGRRYISTHSCVGLTSPKAGRGNWGHNFPVILRGRKLVFSGPRVARFLKMSVACPISDAFALLPGIFRGRAVTLGGVGLTDARSEHVGNFFDSGEDRSAGIRREDVAAPGGWGAPRLLR